MTDIELENVDDRQLVIDAQNNDRRAISLLVARHHAAIYRICFRILFDAEDAADASQDAFIRASRFTSDVGADVVTPSYGLILLAFERQVSPQEGSKSGVWGVSLSEAT